MRKHYKLKDLSSVITSGSRGWAEYYSDIGSLFLRMTNLPKNGIKLLFDNNKYVQLPSNSQEGKRTAVQNDDILISITAELGKIGYVENINDAYVNQHVCLVRINHKQVYSKFIAYYLSSNPSRNLLNRMNDAGAKAGLNLSTIANFPILLPPLHTQRAIADMLDVWDRAIEKTDALVKAKEKKFGWLRYYVIKNALNTKKSEFGNFLTESRIVDTENNPNKRITVRLHLKGVHIRECRGTEIEGATQYFIRKSGQLIYGKQNIFRGSIGIIPNELNGYCSSQDIPAFDIKDSVCSDWLFWYMSQPNFYEKLEHFATGSGSKRLHSQELFKIAIPLPPLPEQRHIAHILNTARSEINLLKKLATQYRNQKQGLMQKLLSGTWGVR